MHGSAGGTAPCYLIGEIGTSFRLLICLRIYFEWRLVNVVYFSFDLTRKLSVAVGSEFIISVNRLNGLNGPPQARQRARAMIHRKQT